MKNQDNTNNNLNNDDFYKTLYNLNIIYLKKGININTLEKYCFKSHIQKCRISKFILITIFIVLISILITQYKHIPFINFMVKYALGTRCLIPNNYLIWEATRPVSDCQFCMNVTKAIILPNLTREQFSKYAYSSGPIILKNAVKHWPAMKKFSYTFFKQLYERTEGAYDNIDEGCQFLHFQSNFVTLRDVFTMSEARAKNLPGEKPWYVGVGNCHLGILNEMRKYYPVPHFLPEDAELSNREYIFFGYNDGATMHLDYISRLMWQAQISGNKTWNLMPTPECESVCNRISFYVEAGDAVILDTRIWYHSTKNTPGIFSLTLQSEYG